MADALIQLLTMALIIVVIIVAGLKLLLHLITGDSRLFPKD